MKFSSDEVADAIIAAGLALVFVAIFVGWIA